MKTCSKCGESLPLDAFGRDATRADGLRSDCRPCYRAYAAGRRQARRATGLPADSEIHGARSGYDNWGCRCTKCSSAKAARQRAWVQANPETVRMKKRRRRAMLAGVESVPYSDDDIIARDREAGGCYLCGLPLPDDRRDIHLDHRIPLVRGGADTPTNVFAVHATCNRLKGTLPEDEARARILAYA